MKQKRIEEMKQYIERQRVVSYDELTKAFSVSVNTVRRDIAELKKDGFLRRVHGGVAFVPESNVIDSSVRSRENRTEKDVMARLAARFLREGDTVFIDSGTTTAHLLSVLQQKANITVVSANAEILAGVMRLPRLKLIALGGIYNHHTKSFSGVNTLENLACLNISAAFFSATCISLDGGLSINSAQEGDIKRVVMKKRPQIIAMTDHTKFDRNATLSFAPLSEIDVLITDRRPAEKYLSFAAEHQIDLLYLDGEEILISNQAQKAGEMPLISPAT